MVETLYIILEQVFMHFPLIMGAYISISLMKSPDLSLESAYVFGAIATAAFAPYVQSLTMPCLLVIITTISVCAGMSVGLLSSTITQLGHIPHLLSSIVVIGIFHGVNQFIAGPYVSLSRYNNPLETGHLALHPELPLLLLLCVIIASIMHYFFTTQLGYCFAVYGNNPSFFKHYGISTRYVFLVGIIVANGLAGLSGYLIAQSNGFADINMGFGKVLLCITALIIGKGLYRQALSIIPALCGLFSYFLLQQCLLKIGFDLRYFTMVQALIILIITVKHYAHHKAAEHDQLGV